MKKINNRLGFSLIEMALSTFMVISISAVTYRVLKNQTTQQMVSMENQKNNKSSQVATSRFKSDASMIDPNWVRYGIAPIYPHQGYGLGRNFYLLSATQKNQLKNMNDGVTFLRRNPNSDRLYVPVTNSKRFCYPASLISGEDQLLYNTNIALDTVENLAVGDWMLVYQAGHYSTGVITHVAASTTTPSEESSSRYKISENSGGSDSQMAVSRGAIRIRMPNANELQGTSNTSSGKSTGFVTKAGVVAASYDYTGSLTESTDDNSFCFESTKASFQKMASPVSYFVDYRTTDGNTKGSNNAYVLDQKQREQIKMLVRAEYVGGVQKREYISQVEEVAITYDLINDNSVSASDRVARNIGRVQNSNHLLNLTVANPSQSTTDFLTSYRIVSMKMGVNAIVRDPRKAQMNWKQYNTMKVSLDPSLQEDVYRDQATVISSLTDDLNTLPKTSEGIINEQIGKPLYFLNGSKENEVMLPVNTFEVLSDGGMGEQSKSGLYVYNTQGCALNGDDCQPSDGSVIVFDMGSRSRFFPNSMVQIKGEDGSRKVIVGGVAMSNGDSGIERKAALGVIQLHPGETLKEKLQAGNRTETCNIADCNLNSITHSQTTEDLMDTSHLSIDPSDPNSVYIAAMTKRVGETSPSVIYKATSSDNGFSYQKFATVSGAEEGKLVSAISDRLIQIGNHKFLAVCLTKKMSSSCLNGECINKDEPVAEYAASTSQTSGSSLGEIQLIPQEGSQINRGIVIAQHNYRCSSLNVDDNQNLIVAGRLTAQPISYQTIKQFAKAQRGNRPVLYLDEAVAVQGNTTYYADYYQVDPSTYADGSDPQFIGWLTGISTVEFPDGTFGMVNGNKIRKELDAQPCDRCGRVDDPRLSVDVIRLPSRGEKSGSSYVELSNAGISKVQLAGMNDRVIATIQTDPNNINNSVISATYSVRSSELPGVYIPGTFYTTEGHPRTTPTPLPAVSPAMSEKSWYQLYQALLTPRDNSGLNSNMPVMGSSLVPTEVSCNNTRPKTCK